MAKTIVVVGLGMVGIAFIEKLLNLDEEKRYRLVTCGEESHLAYNRVALTDYFQHRSVEKLYLNDVQWYAKQDPDRFLFHIGEQVTSLDPIAHSVTTSKGRTITYDHCVLATGSESVLPPYIPPERAEKTKGVFVYRNISDLDKILAYSEEEGIRGGRTVVVGGGLLGLEAAKALFDLNTISHVSIINRQAYPLSRQLDNEGGEIVLRRIEAMGVQVLTKTTVKDITTSPSGVFTGLTLNDDSHLPSSMVIFAIGITPRDDLARKAGLKCHAKAGILVDDSLKTSVEDVWAIGECASWKGNTYGLIAPGSKSYFYTFLVLRFGTEMKGWVVEMADILAFNFTQVQTDVGGFSPRQMNMPDLSTKLKLMGVDVASFGDYFADKLSNGSTRKVGMPKVEVVAPTSNELNGQDTRPKKLVWEVKVDDIVTGSGSASGETIGVKVEIPKASEKAAGHAHSAKKRALEGPVECLTYRDPFSFVYKKYIFTADGKYLLGGMMVGDTSDYVKLVSLVKKKKPIEAPPSEFIVGSRKGEDDGGDLDDDTQNVTKGSIVNCVKGGVENINDLKAKTKVGTGCGGCMPLVTNIFKAELKKAGVTVTNNICAHFAMSRQELFGVVKIRKLKTFTQIMEAVGANGESVGCELCKPVIGGILRSRRRVSQIECHQGSILSSLFNEPVMDPAHHANQDTNDRFLANIQRNGTFSVVPRIAAGEITPDKLIRLGQVAQKYKLYTKITGGQRIDLFGAQKQDLPDIWEELIEAGFESGHAYGKALRTVKSCVGSTWCRYGIGDSVGMAIYLEERYKGIRSPHKIKGGVSGCVRECAEAQSKDFGLIATDKGWNIFLAGNGGANPRHATLFATDVPPSKVVSILDRFLMYYIQTADKLMRTARWVEQFDGGIERLKKILLDDELGICSELEKEMNDLVGTYTDEWRGVLQDPLRRKQFRQFVNTDERRPQIEQIKERGQERPADWPKQFPAAKIRLSTIHTPKSQWKWRRLATVQDLMPSQAGTTSVAAKYGDSQLAIFHVAKKGYYATQQMCPHKRAFVLDHGIVGDDPSGNLYISCPLHKRNFRLTDGECLNDDDYSILAFDVKEESHNLFVLLPDSDELDAIIGTSKWMVRRATAEVVDRGGGDGIEIAGMIDSEKQQDKPSSGCASQSCGSNLVLDW
ncbi:hypothetical protein JAAARDRAFT_194442 [Jaapia argillacea MUCL 33604]|uniref:Rieske domain-containing protein n=1 Tax=Jaapia argillacea MUCL 33604 TaxID=933084 RepID=A0A067Q1A8_9AGAM|nr:hypothetical protein JAAARDRAFT_194442 [Jaapia argillacea MUCL 33604]